MPSPQTRKATIKSIAIVCAVIYSALSVFLNIVTTTPLQDRTPSGIHELRNLIPTTILYRRYYSQGCFQDQEAEIKQHI